jgi:hypothetical protein
MREQIELDVDPELTLKALCIERATRAEHKYRPDFAGWLEKNWHVYKEFQRRADRVWAAGRRHYSARTICEVIRHDSAIRELDGEFKINNNRVPDLARIYCEANTHHMGLFAFRTNGVRIV